MFFFCSLKTALLRHWSQGWLIAAGAYPGFCSMKRREVFLLPLDGMLVHRRSLPRNFVRFPQQIAGTRLYTWVERGTVRVKCLAQEHNTLSPARARTRTASSRVERTKHEATAPPTKTALISIYCYFQGTTTSFLAEDFVPMERYVAVESALSTANVRRLVYLNLTT